MAVTLYWWVDGLTGDPNSLFNAANWSATHNGPGGFGVPPFDYDTQLLFSSGATNDMTLDQDAKFFNIRPMSGYSGTITINGNVEVQRLIMSSGSMVINGDLTVYSKTCTSNNSVVLFELNGNLNLPGVPYGGPGDVIFFSIDAQTATYNGHWNFADSGTRVDIEQNVNRTVSGNLIVNGGTVYFAANSDTTFNSGQAPTPFLMYGSEILNPHRATFNYVGPTRIELDSTIAQRTTLDTHVE